MPIRAVLFITAILIFSLPSSASSGAPEDDIQSSSIYIPYVKTLDASSLDPQLPEVPFEKWLTDTSGPGAVVRWEVNDCGEQPGFPEPGRDYPVCVEANVSMQGGRSFTIRIQAATLDKGITGKPVVSWISINTPQILYQDSLHSLSEALKTP